MRIRLAKLSDKPHILNFCRNTFSWGDYIEHIWDFWYREGYLFTCEKEVPVALIHSFFSNTQVWIEGIRVNENNRHQKIATQLIAKIEKISKQYGTKFSYMLIDEKNSPSMLLAKSLGYKINQKWYFYMIEPEKNRNFEIDFFKDIDKSKCKFYVDSWRFLPLTKKVIAELYEKNHIFKSHSQKNYSVGIITHSNHFKKTILVTLYASNPTAENILAYVKNYAFENDICKIQILSSNKLPTKNNSELKLVFNQMMKKLI